ncbi:YIP1 family protein [Haloarchaeobius amylolyticus]|uniref:YIP1 family protein n=1 Tax=Haloarchaeobius amylolyticus TaxID=1198296 RepID=A0ABD6BK05_9EURY
MGGRLRKLLVDPAAFFDAEAPALSQSVGVLIATGAACLGVIPPVLSLLESPVIPDEVVFDAFPPIQYVTADWAVSIPGIVGVLLAAVLAVPLVAWIAFAALFYLLSWPIATESGFDRTTSLVAWGFVPQLLASGVTLVALFVAFPSTPTEIWRIGVTIPARIYASPPGFDPPFAATTVVGVGCTLWSGYLWAHAVAAARGLTLRQGLAVVAVPTLLVLGPV